MTEAWTIFLLGLVVGGILTGLSIFLGILPRFKEPSFILMGHEIKFNINGKEYLGYIEQMEYKHSPEFYNDQHGQFTRINFTATLLDDRMKYEKKT